MPTRTRHRFIRPPHARHIDGIHGNRISTLHRRPSPIFCSCCKKLHFNIDYMLFGISISFSFLRFAHSLVITLLRFVETKTKFSHYAAQIHPEHTHTHTNTPTHFVCLSECVHTYNRTRTWMRIHSFVARSAFLIANDTAAQMCAMSGYYACNVCVVRVRNDDDGKLLCARLNWSHRMEASISAHTLTEIYLPFCHVFISAHFSRDHHGLTFQIVLFFSSFWRYALIFFFRLHIRHSHYALAERQARRACNDKGNKANRITG